jgi:hypothetical protein
MKNGKKKPEPGTVIAFRVDPATLRALMDRAMKLTKTMGVTISVSEAARAVVHEALAK